MEEKVEIVKSVEVVNDDLINFTDKDGKVTMNDMITMATVIQEEKIDEEIDKLKKEKIKLDKEINGLQLANELGLDVKDIYVNDRILHINIEDEKKGLAAYKAHNPINHPPTIHQKLANAGIDLDELRIALGL